MSGGGAEAILARIEQARGGPLRAMIEISDRCNEVCVHCYQEQGRKGEMTTEQIKAVMDELARIGVLMLTISGGEATLRKDFIELVAHARARGFAVRLFTNGTTMTRALAEQLAELAIQTVEISVYSHRAEVHDFVTGVRGSFEKTVAGIRHLRALGVNVHIKTPIMSVNEHELEPYVEFARGLDVSYGLGVEPLMPREAEDREPHRFSLSAATYAHVKSDPRFGRKLPSSAKPLSQRMCGAGESVLIEPNGELRPCTMLHVDLGNALQDGLRGHASDAATALRALRWADAHGCRACDLRSHCGRCHARSLAEVGDALAPYPSACGKAQADYGLDTGHRPRIVADARADVELGPYRRIAEHVFATARDEITSADDALAARLGWTRREGGGLTAPSEQARPGELVQIRRPGRARARLERIPSPSAARLAGEEPASHAAGPVS